jgi:aconitate hydratase
MGVLPCQFKGGDAVASLGINGDETFDVTGIEAGIRPQMDVTLTIHRKDGSVQNVPVLLRIDTPIEVDYYLNGGILPFVLRELMANAA